MKYNDYISEVQSAKNDHKILTRDGLVLTLTPIIKQYNLPTDDKACWVFQHWRAMPRPKIGHPDQREFGYFIQYKGSLTYKIIPAEKIVIAEPIIIIPLQWRGCFIPGRVPTAGNYFPNSTLSLVNDHDHYVLQRT